MQSPAEHERESVSFADLQKWYETELFDKDTVGLYRLIDEYAAECSRLIATEVGLLDKLSEKPRVIKDVCDELGIVAPARPLVRRVIQILCYYGAGEYSADRREVRLRASGPLFDREELRRRGMAQDPKMEPAFAIADKVWETAAAFCQGKLDDNAVRSKVHIDFFMSCPIGRQCSDLGGRVVRHIVEHSERALELLELGGGTTSGATGILDSLAAGSLLPEVKRYHFTELNPFFVINAKKSLPERYPGVGDWRFLFLNFDRALDRQNIEGESVDLIYGVNCLHCAKDLPFTLSELYKALRPGGWLVIAQFTRGDESKPLPFVDLICDPLASYWDVELIPGKRPGHGLHSYGVWKGLMEEAGFVSPCVFPDEATGSAWFDEKYFLGVVTARKPGS